MEAWTGCGGVAEGGGDSDGDKLREGTEAGCGTLDFLTWTDDGRSDDTCFSKERIYRDKKSLLESNCCNGYFNIANNDLIFLSIFFLFSVNKTCHGIKTLFFSSISNKC